LETRVRTIPQFRPHPLAPVFSQDSNPLGILKDLVQEVTSSNFQLVPKVRELLRQAGFSSLWFFLKYIAGVTGPFERLNEYLHLDMCNFRQSDHCMGPGAKVFAFLPRNHRKTTVFTTGGNTWEITRDCDIRIRLTNAVVSRATLFMRITKNIVEDNELYQWLYPENKVPSNRYNRKRWNDKEIVMSSRERDAVEPTILPAGCEGSAEGCHFNLLNIDDLLGLDDLDVNMAASVDMYKKMQWFKTNHRTLIDDWQTSRIIGAATRYGLDDVYQWVIDRAKACYGYPMPGFTPNKNGEWEIYHRSVREDGQFIQPETMTEEGFTQLQVDDPWTVQTQYYNSPQDSGLAEFKNYPVKRAFMEYQDGPGYIITIPPDNYDQEEDEILLLSELDVTAGADPAGTKDGIKAKICQSAIVVTAKDWLERTFIIYVRHGFWSPLELFNEIFAAAEFFHGNIRSFGVESNAMQKIIIPLLNNEKIRRDIFVTFTPIANTGKKDPRIRQTVGIPMQRGRVYGVTNQSIDFIMQKDKFPMAEYQKDILDAAEMSMSLNTIPDSPEEVEEYERAMDDFELSRNSTTGY